MRPLTARQQEVLDLLKRHLETTGMPPTRAEISRELGFKSANAAEEHLKALSRKGAIEIIPGASRGIRILDNSSNDEFDGLPLVGCVAAGEPILAEQHIEATYRVDADMFKPQADFLLKVYGLSMKNVGILDGDLLAVHSTKDVRNGQIVVARIEDEVTVKRLEKKGSIIYLHAENEEFDPIVVNLEEQKNFEIEGIAVGIIRNNAWM
ncbi:LexA repressor [Haemophilus influenzae 3655]|uniref:LexA repressor n=1 Tax=Haemophilus influenzae (strain NTHi 3655) TaxID=375177 RepID=A0A0H3PNV0_HAEI3|nr:transcriptional repressor LexA [Haemophilus influenzae]EDJ93539.1 LexA repressor [Haemophilus influenzae 3655]KOR01057.1 LexA family transcriptional regulator [Haemophilus influenzae]MCC3182863.1 transcriptional repressor LexA [Haemophilus influenzae]MCK8842826.1 transcriptional repressor LexA [Haemophilus influenzae]MCK8919952.1 transcriptional repressor LexA [Haemophilus influenzae]